MQRLFNTIEDFIHVKEKCEFCGSKLIPKLSNFSGLISGRAIPIIKSNLKEGKFFFKLNYTTSSMHLRAKGVLNIKTNEVLIKIDPLDRCSLITSHQLIEIFESFKPHIELQCCNKRCSMEYYICSNVFRYERPEFDNEIMHSTYVMTKPFLLYWESCNIDKHWVQNDWIHGFTNIISTTNPDLNPMTVPIMDFSFFDKEKLRIRVKTLLVYS